MTRKYIPHPLPVKLDPTPAQIAKLAAKIKNENNAKLIGKEAPKGAYQPAIRVCRVGVFE